MSIVLTLMLEINIKIKLSISFIDVSPVSVQVKFQDQIVRRDFLQSIFTLKRSIYGTFVSYDIHVIL